ncbi:MAG: 50S ribosomal protein L21 [Gammaproteobacteria bacterium]|nr:MAG: 50S ribosomal protein L21 [Gammaproteobacteria bacterium]
MYAVIESGGKQYRVAPGDVIRVEKLEADAGQTVTLDRVLLVAGDSGVQVGTPTVANATVTATVKAHGRGDKILVFKKRRRKHFRKTIGHRQHFTEIEITRIGG